LLEFGAETSSSVVLLVCMNIETIKLAIPDGETKNHRKLEMMLSSFLKTFQKSHFIRDSIN